jgi:hypothetical protein
MIASWWVSVSEGPLIGCEIWYVLWTVLLLISWWDEWNCTTLLIKELGGKACRLQKSVPVDGDKLCWSILIADAVIWIWVWQTLKDEWSDFWQIGRTNIISTSCCWLAFWYSRAESNLTAEEDWCYMGIHQSHSPDSYHRYPSATQPW